MTTSKSNLVKVGSKMDNYIHFAYNYLGSMMTL